MDSSGEPNSKRMKPDFCGLNKSRSTSRNLLTNSSSGFNFYWLDAYEGTTLKEKGSVLLFGKTLQQNNEYINCCVIVHVPRKLYVVPRDFVVNESGVTTSTAVTYQDLHTEFNEKYMKPVKVYTFKTRMVRKRILLNNHQPTNVMEVEYSAKCNQIQFDPVTKPASTFSAVYGIKSSYLETFMLDRGIKGPCWLNISKFKSPDVCVSWCAVEVECLFMDNISKILPSLPIPPIITTTLNLQQSGNGDIILLSCIVQKRTQLETEPADELNFDDHFSVFSDSMVPQQLQKELFLLLNVTQTQKTNSFRAMLNYFINKFAKIDPDVIIGNNLSTFMEIVRENLIRQKIDIGAKLSRLKEPKSSSEFLFTGRIICDIKKTAVDAQQLNESNSEIQSNDDIDQLITTPTGLIKLIEFNKQECVRVLRICTESKCIHLAYQMSIMTGSLLSKTISCGRLNLVESLLNFTLYNKGFLLPDLHGDVEHEGEDHLSGGLVLNPLIGYYNYILVLDFRSLYPSIIQEYNICFTTNQQPTDRTITGLLPMEMKKLVDMRNSNCSVIKKQALKLLANSVYGCLGSKYSRYYTKHLAQSITSKGREILMNVVKVVEEEFQLTVIYGDTDSVMIQTNLNDYHKIVDLGKKIVDKVNQLYKYVKLRVENVFSRFLLENKKKYAGVIMRVDPHGEFITEHVYKGVDIVRKNYSTFTSTVGKSILDELLKEQQDFQLTLRNIQNLIRKMVNDLRAGNVPLEKFVMNNRINKPLESYTNQVPIYITAALKYNQEFRNPLRQGDLVPYVVCISKDPTEIVKLRLALHVLHFKKSGLFTIDIDYYLNHELFPIIRRLCSPLDEISWRINTFLDNITKDTRIDVKNDGQHVLLPTKHVNESKYDKFSFNCTKCDAENRIESLLTNNKLSLVKCVKCDNEPIYQSPSIFTILLNKLNGFVKKYESMIYECDNRFCKNQIVSYRIVNDVFTCDICNCGDMQQLYTESDLYSQLLFYRNLFDTSKVKGMFNIDKNLQLFYNKLYSAVNEFLENCDYCCILDLGKICSKKYGYE